MRRNVSDLMTKTVVVIRDTAPFKEIVRTLDEYRVSALPVVDEEERLVGIVSEADLLLKEEYAGSDQEERLFEGRRRRHDRVKAAGVVAAEVMTKPVVTLRPDASVVQAARLMHEKGIKRLPVVDEGNKVIGIVSRADLLRIFLRSDEEIQRNVIDGVIKRGLWTAPDAIRVVVNYGVVTLEGMLEHRSSIPLLVMEVMEIDGVVGVESRLGYEVDDTHIPTEMLYPWGAVALGPKSA